MDETKSASWGTYHIYLLRDQKGKWKGRIRKSFAQAPLVESNLFDTEGEAKGWAGRALEDLGCQAFVDGSRRRLADFIVYQDSGLRSI